MAWFMVDDKLHSHRKAVRAGVQAMGLWVLAGSWAADHLSDGFVPDYMAERIDPDAAVHAAELVEAGLWTEAERGDEKGWEFHEWDAFQPTREAVEAKREAARERMARVRGNKRDGSREVPANEKGSSRSVRLTPALPIPSKEEGSADAAPRPDVEELCDLLADLVEGNGSKRPSVTKAWRNAARLMLDTDGRALVESKAVMRWSQQSDFWKSNVLSMPKFREKFDTLRLQANRDGALSGSPADVGEWVAPPPKDYGPACPECERPGGQHFRSCSKAAS